MSSPRAWTLATECSACPVVRKESQGLPGDNLPGLWPRGVGLRPRCQPLRPGAGNRGTRSWPLAWGGQSAACRHSGAPHRLQMQRPPRCHDNHTWQPSLCPPAPRRGRPPALTGHFPEQLEVDDGERPRAGQYEGTRNTPAGQPTVRPSLPTGCWTQRPQISLPAASTQGLLLP